MKDPILDLIYEPKPTTFWEKILHPKKEEQTENINEIQCKCQSNSIKGVPFDMVMSLAKSSSHIENQAAFESEMLEIELDYLLDLAEREENSEDNSKECIVFIESNEIIEFQFLSEMMTKVDTMPEKVPIMQILPPFKRTTTTINEKPSKYPSMRELTRKSHIMKY